MTQAITLDPQKAKYVAMRSFIYATNGQPQLAMNDSKAALALDSKSVPALVSEAIVLDGQGKKEQALLSLQKAAEIEPENATVQKMQTMLTQ